MDLYCRINPDTSPHCVVKSFLAASLSVAVKDLMEMRCFHSRGKNPMDELPIAPQTHTLEQLLSLAK